MAAHGVPTFTGKAEQWPSYKAKLMAHAYINIPNAEAVFAAQLDTASSSSDVQDAYHAASCKLHSVLILSLNDMPLDVVCGVANRDGRAAWKCLLDKYEQHSMSRSVQLLHELDSTSLCAGEDPDKLTSKIEHIQRQLKILGVDYSDEQAVAFILRAGILPDNFAPLIPVLLSTDDLSFSGVKAKLRAFYARLAGSGLNIIDAHALHAMPLSTGAARNARRCNHCKRAGHVAADCRLKQASSGTSNNAAIVCHRCGGRGHIKRQCPSPAGLEDTDTTVSSMAQSMAAFAF